MSTAWIFAAVKLEQINDFVKNVSVSANVAISVREVLELVFEAYLRCVENMSRKKFHIIVIVYRCTYCKINYIIMRRPPCRRWIRH